MLVCCDLPYTCMPTVSIKLLIESEIYVAKVGW